MNYRIPSRKTTFRLWQSQKEKRERKENLLKEIMAENVPSLEREMAIQGHEAQRSPNIFNPKTFSLRHIMIKLSKIKDCIFKAAREEQFSIYKGIPVRPPADFSIEPVRTRREWDEIFKMVKEKAADFTSKVVLQK